MAVNVKHPIAVRTLPAGSGRLAHTTNVNFQHTPAASCIPHSLPHSRAPQPHAPSRAPAVTRTRRAPPRAHHPRYTHPLNPCRPSTAAATTQAWTGSHTLVVTCSAAWQQRQQQAPSRSHSFRTLPKRCPSITSALCPACSMASRSVGWARMAPPAPCPRRWHPSSSTSRARWIQLGTRLPSAARVSWPPHQSHRTAQRWQTCTFAALRRCTHPAIRARTNPTSTSTQPACAP